MTSRAPPTIFSASRRRQRSERAARSGERWLIEAMAEDILDRLAFMRPDPGRALVVGDLSCMLAKDLRKQGWETITPDPVLFDEEHPIAGGPYDLVVSIARLDTVNDLPAALLHMRGALCKGGIAICAMPGAGSLPVLRQVMLAADPDRPAPRIHPQIDSRAGTALLERAGFARQVVDAYTLTARYRSLARLVGDLRAQGLNSALASRGPFLGKAALARARAAFEALRDEDDGVVETFEILTLTGWR